MALDLIKSYLIGIGFKVDSESFNGANKSMQDTEDTIKKFNDNNKKGFSDTSDSFGSLLKLLTSSYTTLGKLSPELRTPFAGLLNDIILLKKLYSEFQNELGKTKKPNFDVTEETKKKAKSKNNNVYESPPNKQESNSNNKGLSVIPNSKDISQVDNLVDSILNAKNATGGLTEAAGALGTEGAAGIAGFSVAAATGIGLIIVAAIAAATAVVKLTSAIFDLGKQDIQNEKLSRQLWTTKENAKEVDSALKTLGISMQDLWLSPTLLKQFNELRQDSKNLQLPKEYTDNLKTVQGISLEFARLRQLGSLAFQWIGNYILKYAAGPLNDLKQGLNEFNAWLIKNIPNIGKFAGGIVGFLIRIISMIVQLAGLIIKLTSPIFQVISAIGEIGKAFDNLPGPIKTTLKLIGLAIIAITAPILALVAALDDLFTYLKGGKSLIGDFFNFLFGGNGNKTNANSVANVGNKVQEYNKNNSSSVPRNYTNNNTSNNNTTSNSNNKVSQQNTFHVYGTGNANSAANTIASKVNQNGIFTRNLQGVINGG